MSVPGLPDRVNVAVAPFTYAGVMRAELGVWLAEALWGLRTHERVGLAVAAMQVGYPTDRARNEACKNAKREGFHFLLMLDDDMEPDCEPDGVPFLPGALEFALAQPGPCVVAAPYCGASPWQKVLVMRYEERPNVVAPDFPGNLRSYTREEAAAETGFGRVGALPTGVMLVDLRVMDMLPPPWFAYEYEDPPFNTKLSSSEDTVFSRNADWVGVPQFCAWNSWAAHMKNQRIGKPRPMAPAAVPINVRAALAHAIRKDGGA